MTGFVRHSYLLISGYLIYTCIRSRICIEGSHIHLNGGRFTEVIVGDGNGCHTFTAEGNGTLGPVFRICSVGCGNGAFVICRRYCNLNVCTLNFNLRVDFAFFFIVYDFFEQFFNLVGFSGFQSYRRSFCCLEFRHRICFFSV